jgi:hypothetical protein
MQGHVWPIEGIKKFETLSYLPPLSTDELLKLQLGALPQGRLHVPREREVSRVQRRQTLQKIFYFLTLYISHNIDN